MENVGAGRDVDLHQVKELLDLCGGRKVLSYLPAGANSKLVSGGRTLSGSQKDSILLTRSLLDGPRLLLIDESLQNLSEHQQKTLATNLKARTSGCTIISTVAFPDFVARSSRILYLREGKLIDLGSPQEACSTERTELAQSNPNLVVAVSALLEREKGNQA
jgi:ABC-type bacteriocin/lantibiotic exporter with double-glycine peptidase domain